MDHPQTFKSLIKHNTLKGCRKIDTGYLVRRPFYAAITTVAPCHFLDHLFCIGKFTYSYKRALCCCLLVYVCQSFEQSADDMSVERRNTFKACPLTRNRKGFECFSSTEHITADGRSRCQTQKHPAESLFRIMEFSYKKTFLQEMTGSNCSYGSIKRALYQKECIYFVTATYMFYGFIAKYCGKMCLNGVE